MTFIDAHNHLTHPTLQEQISSILLDCELHSIQYLLVNSSSIEDWRSVKTLAQRTSSVLPHFGVHPWYCETLPTNWNKQLNEVVSNMPCAIGEVGLDGTPRGRKTEGLQEKVFSCQLGIAREHNIPICIHGTRRWHRVYEIVRRERPPQCGILLHSFSGDLNIISRFVDIGAYFTLSPRTVQCITSKTDTLIEAIPVDRLLLETDCPHQSIQHISDKGISRPTKLSTPIDIITLYTLLADRLHVPLETLQRTLSMNFHTLYKTALRSDQRS